MGSNAVSQNAVAAVMGYMLQKGYFNTSSPNLPQNISIFGEANTANQSGLSLSPVQITSAQQAATLYGAGSPIHSQARILFPNGGSAVSVPVWVYPQLAAVSSTAKILTITTTGTATGTGTIYLVVAGRETLDGGNYGVTIVTGDTPTIIAGKMAAAISSVLNSPITATSAAGVTTATTKWTGLTANDLSITIDTNNTTTGCTFAIATTTPGAGTPAVTSSLNMFGNAWNTIVINTYGLVPSTMLEFEAFNGVPDPLTPTGRYGGTTWKPMFVLSGTTLDDPTSITGASARQSQVTIVPCVAPLSAGMPYEAAGNVAYILANILQNSPQSDAINQAYPDMPPPPAGSIPQMTSWTFRQKCVTNGCSTVDFINGQYVIQDLITTYNPTGEVPPFYRYVRVLNIHFNIKYGLALIELAKLQGKTLVNDGDTVTASNTIKPKEWKSDVSAYIDDLVARALIANGAFSKSGIETGINGTNPNRMDTSFPVEVTGIAGIVSTTVTGGFNFGQ